MASERSVEDPMERLVEHIERARQLPGAAPTRVIEGDDPLSSLEQLMAQARELGEQSGPLADLYAQIDEARDLRPHLGPEESGDADPMHSLQERIREEIAAVGRAPAVSVLRSPPPGHGGSGAGRASGARTVKATVGREVLGMLESRPLSGSARVALVRLLAAGLEQPSPALVREALELLIFEK